MLNQNSYEPLYIQIADSIARRIQAGDLVAGDRLPSERQLSEELSVSRMTVRQAFDMLADRGLIERQRGIGSVVSSPKLEQPVDVLMGFSDNMQRKGIKPGARLLALQHQMADPTVAQTLQLRVGQPVYFIHRLRLANDIPMALEFSFFPAHLCPQLDQHDLEQRSVYAILTQEYGIKLQDAQQSLEPTVARPYEAELLGIAVGTPLMLVERTSFDAAGQVVEYAKDLYRGDCFKFVSRSKPPEW